MIRFRIGQSWKREREAAPVDSFGFELDGVDLLSGASEEPLAKVVPELIDAVHALAGGARSAQVSLAEAHLELSLWRHDFDVEVQVVSLGRPARRVRPPVQVELAELVQAAVRCGEGLVRDLSEAAPALLREKRHRKLTEQLGSLTRRPLRPLPEGVQRSGFRHRHDPPGAPGFGFELVDTDDRLLEYGARAAFALPSLLSDGTLTLRLGDLEQAWAAPGPAFLQVLELSRQAAELFGALEAGEASFDFHPAGDRALLQVRPGEGTVKLGERTFGADAAQLARAMFEVGLAFTFAAAQRNKAQAKNPYLTELAGRCREGLSSLKAAVAPGETGRQAMGPRKTASAAAKPLRAGGRLRRLSFERLWEKARLGGDGPGKLMASPRGPIFASLEMACGFSAKGELLFRRVATHGVAASREGYVVTASATRACGFFGGEQSARWLRSHDGVSVGPELYRKDGLLIAPSNGRGVLAFSETTGREVWRLDPPRTQRGFLALQGHRALLATDAGYLYGLDLADGQMRFRVHAGLPFACAPVPWGRRLVGLLARGERSALFVADAHSGQLGWTFEAALSAPSRPLALGARVLVAGRREGQPLLLCVGSKGKLLWERPLPLGGGALSLLAVGRDVAAVDATGAAALVGGEGQLEWRLGAAGDELPCPVAPKLARRVLILPGEAVRAVDPRGGQVLAEVRAGEGLCDLEVDAKLNLFLLDEAGTLRAYRLTSHFAVV
ncbi:MAG: outer membrane protein assembly factor BamB family protein [Myxococcaceae bacterium]